MKTRRLKKKTSGSGKIGKFILIFFSVVLLVAGTTAFFLFFEGEKPLASFKDNPNYIGKQAKIGYTVTDGKSGIRKVTLTAVQGETTKQLSLKENPRTGYLGRIGPAEEKGEITFEPQKFGFKEGKIQVTLEARDFSFRGLLAGNGTTVTRDITLDLKPPVVQLLHGERYISPGGTGIAIYRVSEPDCSHWRDHQRSDQSRVPCRGRSPEYLHRLLCPAL